MLGRFDIEAENKGMRELKDVLHYYLPFKVEMTTTAKGRSAYITTIKRRLKKVELLTVDLYDVMLFLRRKPILHPLEKFSYDPFNNEQIREIIELSHGTRTVGSLHLSTAELCFKNHIDIFGLIGSGQAIESKQ